MTAKSDPKFRVAICGGGIGGITLAIGLAQYADIEIDVYEATPKFEEIGAGIAVWGRGRTVLQRMGLEEKLAAVSGIPPNERKETIYQLRRSDQPSGEPMGTLNSSYALGLHRGRFLSILLSVLADTGRAQIHFGKRCVSFTQGEEKGGTEPGGNPVALHFADDTSATCDVLVGADGIKSAIRGELLRDSANTGTGKYHHEKQTGRYAGTKFSGTVAYRALVNADDLKDLAPNHKALTGSTMYCGNERHVVAYPVGGSFVNFLAYCSDSDRQSEWEQGPWEVQAEPKELLEVFCDWEPEVKALFQCVNKTARWAMYEVEPLPFWSKGRVTLLGDAAHAMPPFIAAGGGQCIEDAYVLARLLGSSLSTRENLPSVLSAYESVRRTRANNVIRSTREAGKMMEFRGEYMNMKNEDVSKTVNKTAEWLWEGKGDPDDDVQEAASLIK